MSTWICASYHNSHHLYPHSIYKRLDFAILYVQSKKDHQIRNLILFIEIKNLWGFFYEHYMRIYDIYHILDTLEKVFHVSNCFIILCVFLKFLLLISRRSYLDRLVNQWKIYSFVCWMNWNFYQIHSPASHLNKNKEKKIILLIF